ncbi:MAG: cold shock domain-containing protein [Kangiellaceae bacterium]|nr:cold shock domain-containing protein [Kangiellaceae bacterium]
MQKQGRLKQWNDKKGFGFISGANGGPDTFIHISAFKDRNFRPLLNQKIFLPLQGTKTVE